MGTIFGKQKNEEIYAPIEVYGPFFLPSIQSLKNADFTGRGRRDLFSLGRTVHHNCTWGIEQSLWRPKGQLVLTNRIKILLGHSAS